MIAADGQTVGKIAALVLDGATWRVDALQVKLRKEVADQVGVTHSIFHAATLEIPVWLIESVGDAVVLSVPASELRHVPPELADAATAR